MNALLLSLLTLLLLAGATTAGASAIHPQWRLITLTSNGDSLPVSVDMRFTLKGWTTNINLDQAKDVQKTRNGNITTWKGKIEAEPGEFFLVELTTKEVNGKATLAAKVTTDAKIETEAISLWLDVPISSFTGGMAELFRGKVPADDPWATLTKHQPKVSYEWAVDRQMTLVRSNADRIVMTDAKGQMCLEAKMNHIGRIAVRDTRDTGGTTYSCRIPLAQTINVGDNAELNVTLKLSNRSGRKPVKLALNPDKVDYKLNGFGGNYCFGPSSPTVDYTLENLRSAWARTEMSLDQWVLEQGRVTADAVDWDYLKSQDKPKSELNNQLVMAQRLQKKGIPYVITVWDVPKWLYAEPISEHRINKDKWPELLALVSSYLQYAKREYGVEPDMFSFNEPNEGVRVKLSAEDHRDIIKLFGARFESLGLKTKMLLGDVLGVSDHSYVRPTIDDPEAMKHVKALAFHSWGRTDYASYEKWGRIAREIKLPLLVTEAGIDATSHFDKSYRGSYSYALGEMRQYQDLLIHAKPQGFMYWEFTGDYSLLEPQVDANGQNTSAPSHRFYFMKHFCNLTPPNSDVLTTTSDTKGVLFTAFRGNVDSKPVYTLHISNLCGGDARKVNITGLPAGVTEMRAILTSENDMYKDLGKVRAANGRIELEMQPESMLTLTTMP